MDFCIAQNLSLPLIFTLSFNTFKFVWFQANAVFFLHIAYRDDVFLLVCLGNGMRVLRELRPN